METFATIFLAYHVLAYWLEPELGVWLEEFGIIQNNLEDEYLDVHMSVLTTELF